jgi:hypothetical protein
MKAIKNFPCKHKKGKSVPTEAPLMSLCYKLFSPLKFGYDDPQQRPEIHTTQVGKHYRDALKLMFNWCGHS